MYSILIVEDEKPISNLIKKLLCGAGYSCTVAEDGQKAADLIENNDYDLILLDIMLPIIDGYELMDYIASINLPAIFVTAKTGLADRVKGIRTGAYDYITKPFEPEELLARVENVLRRNSKNDFFLNVADVELDSENRIAKKGGHQISLTPREFDLLELLMKNIDKTLLREYLYDMIWGEDDERDSRTLDTHIKRLRQKLDWQDRIITVYKTGYRLEGER